MQSRTSFFNRTAFLSDLRRWWPLTALYTLVWLMILPLSRLTDLSHDPHLSAWNVNLDTLNIAVYGGYVSAFLTGILFAMAAFSYLTNPRATNGLHALPARRESLFVTHYLAGLCSQLAPQIVVLALTAAVLGSHGVLDLRAAGLGVLALALPTVFFYSFGVLCMVFTGQILAAPVFYGVLNVLVVGVETLVKAFAGNFLYGWAESDYPALMALSPIVKLVEADVRAIGSANEYYDTGSVSGVRMTGELMIRGIEWLWIYAAAGLVIAALALLVYRARPGEGTGSTVAIPWARPIFRYGVAFCAALALGQLVYYIFFGRFRSNGSYSLFGSLACMAAAGLLGYFIAEMLLRKSFRVWKTGWKGALGMTAALVALGVVLSLDLTGYEGYVPDPDAVDTVQVDMNIYAGGYAFVAVDDPETIRLAQAAHRAILADKARQQSIGGAFGYDTSEEANVDFTISYYLRSGRVVKRRYNPIRLYRSELGDGASPAAALTALYNDRNVTLSRTLGRWHYEKDDDPRNLPDLRFTGGYYSHPQWENGYYHGEDERDLTPTEAKAVYEAALRDVQAGNAVRELFGDGTDYVSVQLFATYLDTRDYSDSTAPAWDEDGRAQTEFDVAVTPRMTETLATLRAMGIEIEF